MTCSATPAASRSHAESGQAAIEFGIVLMLVVVVLFGVIEVARVMLAYTALADAARAGTRYAIVHGSNSSSPSGHNSSANVAAQVTGITGIAGLSGVTTTVSYPNNSGATGSGNATGNRVRVTVSHVFVPVIGLNMFSPLNMTLTSTSEGIICY
ncbi:MAG: pilus assembly protein [Bryobacterales bacterium]|nr:pilus assembly protein [Bryobacterales bacterium]